MCFIFGCYIFIQFFILLIILLNILGFLREQVYFCIRKNVFPIYYTLYCFSGHRHYIRKICLVTVKENPTLGLKTCICQDTENFRSHLGNYNFIISFSSLIFATFKFYTATGLLQEKYSYMLFFFRVRKESIF